MTMDFSCTWLSPSQSPCSDPNDKLWCWERCVKRKYNDGSGQLLQGYNRAHTKGDTGSFSYDAMWCTMPSIAHCHKTSITSRTRHDISSLQDKQCDSDYNLMVSTDHPLQPPHIPTNRKDVSKKRIHMATSIEASHGAVQECDMATEHEVLRLKEALKFEKFALRKLYKDLEEERCASATAANEAMAMIRRLQEEKAAALVESRQYKRASEEREAYNQEAIALVKNALSVKEHEIFYLQNHIENYRKVLRKMKLGQQLIQMIESKYLEGDKENSQLLLLEGKETASCSLVESKYLEGNLDKDCDTGNRAPGESMQWHHYFHEESILEGPIGLANLQCGNHSSDTEQDFEDVNLSILARVARLEEQFVCLGQNEVLDPETFDLTPHNMSEDTNFTGCDKTDSAPMHNVELSCSNSVKLNNGFMAINLEDSEDLKCPVFERVTTNSERENHEHSCLATFKERGLTLNADPLSSKKHLLGLCKASDCQVCSYLELEDTACEDGHDANEIQRRADGSDIPYLDHINMSHKSGFGDGDFLLLDLMKVLEDKTENGAMSIYGKHLPFHDGLAGCDTSMNEKMAAKISSAVGNEAVKSSLAAKDLQHLKVRLQALEGERAFMKEAIEALRKENMELKLLQEIAHHLQELKGSGCHNQLPFLSFFKRILSFAGLQSLTCTEKRRFSYGCQGSIQASSKKTQLGGLRHLLNNSLQEENSVCVTRERKVKLAKLETLTAACNLRQVSLCV